MRVKHKLKKSSISKLEATIFIIIIISAFIIVLIPLNISFLLFICEPYVLHNNFILDSGAIVYIYNNLARFTDLYPVTEFVLVGDNIIPIKIYSIVIITYIISSGPTRVPLMDIIYILGYYINLISLQKVIKKNLHFNI